MCGSLCRGTRFPNFDQRAAFYDQSKGELESAPGVRAVGGISFLPFGGWSNSGFGVEEKTYSPDEDPIGKRIGQGTLDNPRWSEVVGVVGDVKHHGLTEMRNRSLTAPTRNLTGHTLWRLFYARPATHWDTRALRGWRCGPSTTIRSWPRSNLWSAAVRVQ